MLVHDKYWASEDYYSPKYLDRCIDKINIYRNYCTATGKNAKWQSQLQNYYGISSDGTKGSGMVTRGGDSGQFTMMKVNDFRNIIRHQLSIITSNRPAGQGKAINSDTKSLHQARIASLLSEYTLSQVGWEVKFKKCAEGMLVSDECFLALDWNEHSGSDVRPEMKQNPETGAYEATGQMIKTGDCDLRVIYPWNMCRDPYINSREDMKWGIYCFRVNKYDLAAIFPEAETDIIIGNSQKIQSIPFVQYEADKSDQITLYCVVHDKTPACKRGRYSLLIDCKTLIDGEFPYPEFNIYSMTAGDVIETPFGYSPDSDLLAMEEVTDALHSIIVTNQITFGTQNIIAEQGIGISYQDIAKGCTYFEVKAGAIDKIKPLALAQTPPEIFNYLNTVRGIKYQFGGIDPVTQGDLEGGLRSASGSALALIQSQSIKFNSDSQAAYYQGLSKVMTGKMMMDRRYADNERIAKLVGKVQSQYIKEFKWSGRDLENVSAVVFEPVDPIFQTIGGKVSVADSLLEKGMIKNAHQYINVVRTGDLDVFTEDDESMQIAQKAENELLREGEEVQVVVTENHEEHIECHKAVIASPESKKDLGLMQRTLNHIQEHTDMWMHLSQTNPALLIATGQKVLPLPGGPQPTPMGAPGAGGPPDQIPKLLSNSSPTEQKAKGVQLPQMPKNPATGERVPQP